MKTTKATAVSLRTNRSNRKATLRRSILAASAAALLGLGIAPQSVTAAPAGWNGSSATWQNATSWTPNGIPIGSTQVTFSNVADPGLANLNATLGVGAVADTLTAANAAWGFTGGTLALTTGTIDVGAGAQVTFFAGGSLTGAGGITKTGLGALLFDNANSYTGATVVNGGSLSLFNVGTFGNGNSAMTIGAAGTVTLQGVSASIASLSGVAGAQLANNNAAAATLTIAGTNGAAVTYAGTLFNGAAGALSLIKNGAGTQILTGANSYTGATTVGGGILQVDGSITGSIVSVNSGGTLTGSGTITQGVNLNGTGIINLSAGASLASAQFMTVNGGAWNGLGTVSSVFVNSGNLSIGAGANLTTTGTLSVNNAATFSAAAANSTITGNVSYFSSATSTFQGVIAGAASNVTVNTGATNDNTFLELNGTNTYGGATQVTSGTLIAGSNGALSGSGVNVANGGTLMVRGGVTTAAVPLSIVGSGVTSGGSGIPVGALFGGAFTGSSTYAGAITLTGAARIGQNATGAFTLTGGINTAGNTVTFGFNQNGGATTGSFNVNSIISGAGGVVVDAQTTNLNASNTYTGTTSIINGGILNASAAGALPAPAADGGTGTARSALIMDQSGTGSSRLNLVGFDQAVASLTGAATSTINLNAQTLTVGTAGGTTNFAGVISGVGGNLLKDGTSVQVLSNNNTYTGTTRINDGTLRMGITNALPTGTALTINPATGNTRGLLDLNGFNTTIASLTIVAPNTSGNVVSGAGILTVNGNIALVDNTTVAGNAGQATIAAGALDLGGATRTFNVASQNWNGGLTGSAATDLHVTSVIQNGGVIIAGTASTNNNTPATVEFTGTNTYAGGTQINANSVLLISNNSGLGTGAATVQTGGTLTLNNGVNIANALFLNGSGAGAGTPRQHSGALEVLQGGTATVTGLITAATNATISTNGNGSVLNLNGGINKTGVVLTFTNVNGGTGTINVNAPITGNTGLFNSDLIVNGVTTNLNAPNTYLGPTFITSIAAGDGVLNANVANAMPIANGRTSVTMDAGGAGSSVFNIGGIPAFPLGANQSIASLAGIASSRVTLGNNTLTIGFGSGLNVFGTAGATFAGVISGTSPGFAIIKDDLSTQILTGINTYIGFTAVNGGTLQVGDGVTPFSQLGTGLVFVNPTGTLDIRLANGGIFANTVNTAGASTVVGTNTAGNTQRITGAINGTANFLQNAGGTSVFENVNTYQGGTRITNASTIIIGTLTAGATAGQNISTNTVVVDTGSTLNLVNVSGGVLNNNITNGNGGAGLVTSTSTFATTLTGSLTDGAAGTLALTQNGSGTTTLVNAGNTYTGATTVIQGTLQVGTAGLVGSVGNQGTPTTIVVGTGGTLAIVNIGNAANNTLANSITNGVGGAGTVVINSANTNTLSGALTDGGAGTVALTQSGTGTTILTNAGNTYTGATTISGGTLQLGTAALQGSIGGANVNLGTGGTLNVVNVGPTPAAILNNIQNNLGGTGLVNNSSTAGVFFFGNILDGVGSIAFTQSGTGASFLTGTNTYSGVTNVTAGTLFAGSSTALGSAANGTVVAAGATLDLNGQTIAAEAVQIQGTGDAAGAGLAIPQIGALSNSGFGVATLGGPVTLAASASIGSASGLGGIVLTNSVIGGAAATLTKVGTDTLTLNGVNIYSGATLINAGIVIAGNASALGNIGAGTTVANGAALQIANGIFVIAEPLTINGAGVGPAAPGALTQALGGTSSFAGPITVATNSTINANGGKLTLTGPINKTGVNLTLAGIGGAGSSITVNGIISGNTGALNSDLIVNGTTANLNAANTYLGQTFITSIAAGDGIVNANVASALPTSPVRTQLIMDAAAAGNAAAAAGAGASVLNLAGSAGFPLGASQSVASLTSAAGTGSVVNLGANTLTIGFGTANVNVGYVNSTFNGVINGTGGITKDETSVQILAGQSTYTGATLVSGGTLQAGVASVAGVSGAFGLNSAVTVTQTGVPPNAILDLAGFSNTIGSLAGGNVNSFVQSTGGIATLTTGTLNTNTDFAGVLQDGAGGQFHLTKVGTGIQILSGTAANTYSGATFVSAGELHLNKTAGVDATGNGNVVTGFMFIGDGVGGGANSDILKLLASNQINDLTQVFIDGTTGKLDLNNFNETIAVLSDSGNPITPDGSSVALGTGTLTFGDNTGPWTFSGAITGTGNIIKNGTGTEIFAGTTTANTFSGTTTVNAGLLQLNKSAGTQAIGGHMTIGDGLGGPNSDIVQLLASNQIIDTSRISIDGSSGRLDINGQIETIAWFADTGVVAVNGSSLDLGAGGTLNYGNASNQTFSGAITGTGFINKNGTGTQTLAGTTTANTFSGLTTVNAGQLDLNKTAGTLAIGGNLTIGDGAGPGVVPTASSDIVRLLQSNQILATSLVLINGTTGKLDLNGNTQTVGSIADTGVVTANGSNINLGGGTLTTNAGGGANPANPSTTFSGSITGAGGNLTKEGTGILTLAGAATSTNTYSGLTTVNAGELDLNKSGGAIAVGGNLNIGNGAGGGANSDIVKLLQSNQIIATSVVQINASTGRLDLNNQSQTVGSIASTGVFTLGGSTIALGSGALTTGNAANTAYSGVISGTGTLTKQGTGIFTLSGANTYSGPTTVNAGTLSLAGGAALADTTAVTVNAAGTLNLVASETIASLAGSGAVTLNAQTLTTGVDNTSTTHSGVISGAGGALVKEGTGFFTVSGANTYTGGTTVNNGTLGAANGSAFGNGNLTMNGGTIQTVGGPLIVNIGAGNVQFNGGTYIANVGGTTPGVTHDQLLTTGTAAFPGGTLALVQNNGYTLAPGDKVNLAIATGGVAGGTAIGAALPAAAVTGLAAFSNTPLLVPTVNLYTTSVTLEAMQGSFAGLNGQTFGGIKVAYTPNQIATAAALDSVARTINNKTGIFKELNFLDTQSLSTLPSNLDKIAPEEYSAIFTTSYSLANIQSANLQRRMDDIRTQATVPSMPSEARGGNTTVYADGARGPVGRRSKEIAPPSNDRWGMFLSGSGEFTRVGSTTNAAGYKLETGGVTAGIDYRVNTNFAIGLDLGYVGTSARLANGGKLDNDGGRLGIYATYFDENFHMDVAVNGGLNSYKTRRTTPNNTSATGSPDGSEINVLVAAGYDWKFGGLTLGPTASFQYTNVHMDGFNETGSFAPLAVSGQSGESSRTALGIRAYYDAHVGRIIVRPEVRASWQHEFGDTSTQITSRFSSLGGNAFTVTGPVTGRDSLLLGAGCSILLNDRTSIYVYYDGELGRSNYDSHNISGGLRLQF